MGACRSEDTFSEKGPLFLADNYHFTPVFGPRWGAVFRNFKTAHGSQPYRSTDHAAYLWGGQEYKLVEMKSAAELHTSAEIVMATREHRPLVAQVELIAGNTSLQAVLEFPIKQMKTLGSSTWQVDTGPIVIHDLLHHEISAEGLQLAYIAFNRLDSVDLIVEVPTDVGHGIQVMAYSEQRTMAAKVRLFASANKGMAMLHTALAHTRAYIHTH